MGATGVGGHNHHYNRVRGVVTGPSSHTTRHAGPHRAVHAGTSASYLSYRLWNAIAARYLPQSVLAQAGRTTLGACCHGLQRPGHSSLVGRGNGRRLQGIASHRARHPRAGVRCTQTILGRGRGLALEGIRGGSQKVGSSDRDRNRFARFCLQQCSLVLPVGAVACLFERGQ